METQTNILTRDSFLARLQQRAVRIVRDNPATTSATLAVVAGLGALNATGIPLPLDTAGLLGITAGMAGATYDQLVRDQNRRRTDADAIREAQTMGNVAGEVSPHGKNTMEKAQDRLRQPGRTR
jgi:hypothetical protein